MKHFGIMIKSKDLRFDGTWLSASKPTTREPSEAMYWTSREAASRYLHNRFDGDPNLHVDLYVEELLY